MAVVGWIPHTLHRAVSTVTRATRRKLVCRDPGGGIRAEGLRHCHRHRRAGSSLRVLRSGFTFGGLTFEEYRGQATDVEGRTRRFIAAGEAHCFPMGTVDTFATYVAPADFNETVNTLGQPLHAKQEPRKFERGTDLHTQSNPLPMCHRPGVLVKLTV